ncbi:hypothetical protein CHCC14821_1721 [Bacillus paralicheniformis]|nr:hypothetical protein CHCC14821_1721 [Bacillus paralicheniformis]
MSPILLFLQFFFLLYRFLSPLTMNMQFRRENRFFPDCFKAFSG